VSTEQRLAEILPETLSRTESHSWLMAKTTPGPRPCARTSRTRSPGGQAGRRRGSMARGAAGSPRAVCVRRHAASRLTLTKVTGYTAMA